MPLFKSAFYITVSPDGATIYATDHRNGSVICLSMDGQILGIYMLGSNPYGIAFDETGSVFVCMTDPEACSGILQLSDDCESAKTLFKVDGVFLSAMTYCNENQSFFMPKYDQPEILVVKTENVDKD
jgi:DNA-binding beta-propeller fold protein YncE